MERSEAEIPRQRKRSREQKRRYGFTALWHYGKELRAEGGELRVERSEAEIPCQQKGSRLTQGEICHAGHAFLRAELVAKLLESCKYQFRPKGP